VESRVLVRVLRVTDKPFRNADVVAQTVMRGDDADVVALNRWIKANAETAGPLFEQLSRHPDPEVRDWVAFHSRRVGYSGAVELLARMTADRNATVQEVAIGELMELDMDAARRTVGPRIRRQLRSRDDDVRIVALWRLVRLGDRDSIPLIRRMREERSLLADDTEFAELVLEGKGDEVLDVLRQHQHERTPSAARAAMAMRSDSALDALHTCADDAPDESCRRTCRLALSDLLSRARAPK